jgi:SAM-dependent methyltransferase
MQTITTSPALAAYEEFAPHYDTFTADYDYDRWLDALERLLLEHGLPGRRILDIACGSGKSFSPLLARGYEVSGCDLSPSMVRLAQQKVPYGAGRIRVADMRDLHVMGEFDAALCLCDSINYLLDVEDLEAFFTGAAANLRPGGLLAFDANTLATYRSAFVGDSVVESDTRFMCWRGQGDPDAEPGTVSQALIETFELSGEGRWERSCSVHVQRHHTHDDIADALEAADLELLRVLGQSSGARLHDDFDELVHHKVLYLARRPRALTPEGSAL